MGRFIGMATDGETIPKPTYSFRLVNDVKLSRCMYCLSHVDMFPIPDECPHLLVDLYTHED